ncbi:MAG: T9SS type A sorting domain-containing protein [Bacteroidota bacterium]
MRKLLFLISFIFSFLHFSYSQNPLVKQWDKRFGGTDDDEIICFQQTKDGGYIIGGFSFSDSNGNKTQASWDSSSISNNRGDYWIVKIDSFGNKQWDKTFGSTNADWLFALQQTIDGGYIIGGYSKSGIGGDKTQVNWDSLNLTNDYWILKIDSLGNKQWDKDFGGTGDDRLYSLQQTDDKGYILGGFSKSDSSGDKTQNTVDIVSSTYRGDYWIVKIDSLGIKQWDKDFGGTDGDWLFSMEQTADGGYILFGYSYSGISGDKTQASQGGLDYWIVKTDSLGNKQWDKDFGGHNPEESIFGNVFQTSDEGYLLAGTSYSNISGDKTENNLGIEQTWIVKTDSLGNPATQTITLKWAKEQEEKQITINDLFGREVLQLQTSNFKLQTEIDISFLSPGIYFLKAGNEVKKFVKE